MPAPVRETIAAVLTMHGRRRERLVQVLREVQSHTGWLSRPVIEQVAAGIGLSPAVVEGVAGFYRFFHLHEVAPVHILFSDSVSDRMQGSRDLAEDLCRRLQVPIGHALPAASASVDYTSCTGLPDQGPALLVNQRQIVTRMDAARVADLADLLQARVPPADWPAGWQEVTHAVHRADGLLGAPPAVGEALRKAVARGAQTTLADIVAARLRGRGGAGYPTGQKWDAARHAPLPPRANATRVVVCNADEGEPGTFKDRVLLALQPDAVVEGMTLAAHVLGAREGYLYLRGEYDFMHADLQAVLARRRAAGLLGRNILGVPGFDFDIEIHLGAGAYVCGEESALLESLEGKRGTPRIRPPFPAESGYMGQPTIVNNVETFAAAAQIVLHGPERWASVGTPESTGTKLHSVSGDCARPGMYEFPFGVTIAELLHACGAHETGRRVQAVQIGGPSGVCVGEREFDRRLAFEDVPTTGAFTVFDERRDMFEVARGWSHFFAHESCGFCTPCRVGTELVARRMDKLADGFGSLFDEAELRGLQAVMHGTTHCALGATATNPLRDTLLRFRPAYERRLQRPRFVPGFDLDAELASARRVTGRDDALAHLERDSE